MRVLVVEDEIYVAQAIADGRSAEGFDVELSHDGLDGPWRARERPYGAIVLDILLPGIERYSGRPAEDGRRRRPPRRPGA